MVQQSYKTPQRGLLLDRVTKQYGSIMAVDHLSLTVENREFLAIVGPTGCGKTSLLRLIAGVEQLDFQKAYQGFSRR